MAREYTTIKVSKRTKERLEELRRKIREEEGYHLSIDALINILINHYEGKGEAPGAAGASSHLATTSSTEAEICQAGGIPL